MSLNQEVCQLKSIPFFANIDTPKLKLLAFTSERVCFKQGQSLCRQGEPGDAAYIIMDGSADVVLETGEQTVRLGSVGRNDIIGEIAMLIGVPRTATVTATSELSSLRISRKLFLEMAEEFPEVSLQVLRVLARRLESTTARLRSSLN